MFRPSAQQYLDSRKRKKRRHNRRTQKQRNEWKEYTPTPERPVVQLFDRRYWLDELDHTLVFGASGAKKTTTMMPFFRSLVEAIQYSRHPRFLKIITVKAEPIEYLVGIGVPFILKTLTHLEGYAPDIASDDLSEHEKLQRVLRLLPRVEGNNAVFRDGAIALLFSLLTSIHHVTGGQFVFADVYNAAVSDLATQVAILEHSIIGRQFLDGLLNAGDDAEEFLHKLRADLFIHIQHYRVAAAKTQFPGCDVISEWDFWNGNTDCRIEVLKLNPSFIEIERPFVNVELQQNFDIIYELGESAHKDKFFWLEDFNFYKKIDGLDRMTELGRSYGGVMIALAQTLTGLRAKDSYGDSADAALGNFGTFISLGTGSGVEAQALAREFGASRRRKENITANYGGALPQSDQGFGGGGISGGSSVSRQIEDLATTSDFLDQIDPRDADTIRYHMRSRKYKTELNRRVPAAAIRAALPPRVPVKLHSLSSVLEGVAPWSQSRRDFLVNGKHSIDGKESHFPDVDEVVKAAVIDLIYEEGATFIEQFLEGLNRG